MPNKTRLRDPRSVNSLPSRLGLVEAMYRPMTRVALLSRSHRQSRELLKTIVFYYKLLGEQPKAKVNAQEIELVNMSRIVCVPCLEDTIHGYAHVDLLIIDEAARVPEDLYRAVRPLLAVSKGRIICLSTPYGKRGFFWNAWAHGGSDWDRIEIPAAKVPRIGAAFLEKEKRGLGESWLRQEYFCSFEALERLVYPDFADFVVPAREVPAGLLKHEEKGDMRRVGGIDFGFGDPFAAVWGVVDRDDILWLTGEHYARQRPLSYHAERLPRKVTWYADPSGANEIAELRRVDFTVKRGENSLRSGIGAVAGRLQSGTLRIVEGRCANLLAEAGLYRYDDSPGERLAEVPLDEHNHALAALRYLIYGLDARRLGSRRAEGGAPQASKPLSDEEMVNRKFWEEFEGDD